MVMAGYRGDHAAATAGLSSNRPGVRAAALSALARLGALDRAIATATGRDPSPEVRRRLCQLGATMPEVPLEALVSALADQSPSVVETAAWALGERVPEHRDMRPGGGSDEAGALAAIATAHQDPLCREAAVASLGAIGHPSSLAAVLACLGDKPAIRRRAVLALAAFQDDEVEDALRRCLQDRDWQVREAAACLLSAPSRGTSP